MITFLFFPSSLFLLSLLSLLFLLCLLSFLFFRFFFLSLRDDQMDHFFIILFSVSSFLHPWIVVRKDRRRRKKNGGGKEWEERTAREKMKEGIERKKEKETFLVSILVDVGLQNKDHFSSGEILPLFLIHSFFLILPLFLYKRKMER